MSILEVKSHGFEIKSDSLKTCLSVSLKGEHIGLGSVPVVRGINPLWASWLVKCYRRQELSKYVIQVTWTQHVVLKEGQTVMRCSSYRLDELFKAEARINDLTWKWQKKADIEALMTQLANSVRLESDYTLMPKIDGRACSCVSWIMVWIRT